MHLFNEAASLLCNQETSQRESLKAHESKWSEQELDDDDRQTRFWRSRPDAFVVNDKEKVIYVLQFKRVLDAGETYVTETQ
jgi:hypothetical protein